MNDQVRQRQIERHCAVSIRALSGHTDVEFRQQLLFEKGRGIPLICPHLRIDVVQHSIGHSRGVTDAMALRLAHTDLALHQSLMPTDEIAQMIFDILEQLRVESLAPRELKGVKKNLEQAFNEWCRESRGNGLIESELGLLIYTITQIVRAQLINQPQDEEVEGLIEATRFRLAPLIGDQLVLLRRVRVDQQAYGVLALKIAEIVAETALSVFGKSLETEKQKIKKQLKLPRQHTMDDRYVEGYQGAKGETFNVKRWEDDYPVFCSDFDRQQSGENLYRIDQRRLLRRQLDKLVIAQAISVSRLAQQLKNLFAIPDRSNWDFGEEEGYLDGRRLGQLIANPCYQKIFKRERHVPKCNTVVSFLIDNSGSMKHQRYEAVAVMVDVYARAMELAGIRCEILGFTTGGWAGGQSIHQFRAAGMPSNPGRLNDRLHIVYKDAETSWRRSRYSIAAMLNTTHFREGLDGEALDWAYQRLLRAEESRRCLVMISDGAPMDSATSQYNAEHFLDKHLKRVVEKIEQNADVELRAIGIGLDMNEYFSRSMPLDLTGTLGNRVFQAIETLYC